MLSYLQENPNQTCHGHFGDLSQTKVSKWLHSLSPVLEEALEKLGISHKPEPMISIRRPGHSGHRPYSPQRRHAIQKIKKKPLTLVQKEINIVISHPKVVGEPLFAGIKIIRENKAQILCQPATGS
ncbi:MAG: hypothetical protein GFH27_549397n48 [Chloroflexi bacterium AL-W]|nr:hypothetical protein [Chloroflexi bacterium AL-W]